MPSRTDRFRTAQTGLQVEAMRRMAKAWRLLNPQELDGTLEVWLAESVAVASGMHGKAVASASAYYSALKAAKTGSRSGAPDVVVDFDHVDMVRRLTANGPAVVKRAMSLGHGIERAAMMGLTASAQEVAAHTRDAARSTVMQATNADPRARGWARVGGGSECGFCAMLIGRGAVYSESSANFEAHRSCQCDAEPVFGESWDGKDHADDIAEKWDRVTEGRSGQDAINAWNAKRAATDPPRESPKVEPVRMTAAQIAEKARTQAEWAETHGWSTHVDGRTVTGTRTDGGSIRWTLTDAGAWRVDRS